MADLVLLVHLLATAFMTGLIWFVQLVHYPLMKEVAATGFAVEVEPSCTILYTLCAFGSIHVHRCPTMAEGSCG